MRSRPGVDLWLVLSAGLILLIAFFVLASGVRGAGPGIGIGQHAIRVAIAVAAAWAAWRLDTRILIRAAPILFAVVLVLAVAVNLAGALRAGTNRWIEFGVVTLQPGEFAKPALVLLAAHLAWRSAYRPLSRGSLFLAAAMGIGLVFAVANQPDLGSAAILIGIAAGIAFLTGHVPSGRAIAAWAGGAVLALPTLWIYGLRDYQKARILSFLSPGSDPLGAGYQAVQAQVAVGSGGLFGVGWMEGSQTAYQFLPAPHTDFVFAVLAEEFGFLGVSVVLTLYLVLGVRLLWIATEAVTAREPAAAVLVGGLFLMLFLQTIYNIGMVAGLLPVKGFPLPLMSYGGNSLLVTGAAIGLAASVRRRLQET